MYFGISMMTYVLSIKYKLILCPPLARNLVPCRFRKNTYSMYSKAILSKVVFITVTLVKYTQL